MRVGVVTSCVRSPTLGKVIALARVVVDVTGSERNSRWGNSTDSEEDQGHGREVPFLRPGKDEA